MELKIKKLHNDSKIPTRGTDGSAGLDLYAYLEHPITIEGGETAIIPTGISIALPSNEYGAFIYPRSGLSIKHGIGLLNSVGVIDSDYRGEICVGIINQISEPYTIEPFERIAQMVIHPVVIPQITECEYLEDTDRGEGRFGSTGTK